MQKITKFFKSYTHFYQKEQHLHALSKWRNGLLFLLVLSIYSAILPWWTAKKNFNHFYSTQVAPLLIQAPDLYIKNDEISITNKIEIKSSESDNTIILINKELDLESNIPIQISEDKLAILHPDFTQILYLSTFSQLEKTQHFLTDSEEREEIPLKDYLQKNSDFIRSIQIHQFFASVRSLFFTNIIQCAFLAGLFFFLHRRIVRAPFMDFFKISILACVPFSLTLALFLFYENVSFFATLIPTILHFIFFFRAIPSLIEFQEGKALK
ncbi:DUF1189 family protein [Lentisphaera profundi]|uniref:DUF1189 family protein n=1 Tax=Lentisphaera profundi TaxID=1658616 RepID=A0ABY7VPG1_9BACT|nr:DUF1189 family protein [Lentisphaera profundi]WDE96033.1 DUF1189 family protein [Lentisphaera profundi]